MAVVALTSCNSTSLNAPGLFDRDENVPLPDTTIAEVAKDGLQEADRRAIAQAVGAVDLSGPSTTTVAQIPETATSAVIVTVKLDEMRGVGCRAFTSTLSDRRGSRDFNGAVCPTRSGWRLLQPGENSLSEALPGVVPQTPSQPEAPFVTAPPPTSTGPVVTPTEVPLIASDLVDSSLFGSAVPLDQSAQESAPEETAEEKPTSPEPDSGSPQEP